MTTLLLVEDDASLGQTLKERLEKENYTVLWARTVSEASRDFKPGTVDLVILDVGLPDGSGFDFALEIRRRGFTPFLFLTAQAGAPERLRGFELGAEEFIPKPFHLKELLLRVRNVLARPAAGGVIHCGGVKIDLKRMGIIGEDGMIETLALKDFQLLKHLLSVSPRVVSREEILSRVWSEEKLSSSRTIDNVVVRLRQLLKDDGTKYIQSIRGVGYQWIGPETASPDM